MHSVNKKWGIESLWVNNNIYSSKIIIVKEGEKTEKIFNRKRDRTILVLQGIVQLNIENTSKILKEGESYHISPKIINQLIAIKGDATILEVGTEFLENDIVTIEV